MVFAGWELADGTLFSAGALSFEQFLEAADPSLISYSAPVYTFDENGDPISATCEASLDLTALFTPSEAAQEGEKRIIVTFYGSYDKLLGRSTLTSIAPETTFGLPVPEAPEGKVFNGWMLTCCLLYTSGERFATAVAFVRFDSNEAALFQRFHHARDGRGVDGEVVRQFALPAGAVFGEVGDQLGLPLSLIHI